MSSAYIIDACRTPRGLGKAGKGSLSEIHPQRLGSAVLRALAERNNLNTADIDDVIWGTSCQKGRHGGDLGRMSALDAGYDVKCGGMTLDRFCGSGLTSVNLAAASIMSGMEDLIVAGGCEMMSSYGVDNDLPLLMDSGNEHLRELHPQPQQGVSADAIATLEGIDRQALDSLAVESQRRAAIAIKNGHFQKSIIPVYHEDGRLALAEDECPRPGTTLEGIAGLKPAFTVLADYPLNDDGLTYRKLLNARYPIDINHVHHAGNSSGVADGAAAVLLASEDYVASNNLKPRAKIIAMANAGDCPTLMLNAPTLATTKVLKKARLELDDIDLFEVNEAFAVVVERYIRHLGIDREKINVNGGAMALGHPIGATGSVLVGTMIDELERRNLKRGLITMCTGGGMAPALIIERI